ncbi:uncharacterized protein G2W53_022414 [Senna tora]|uniref:Uncharacterized protein n=1 Tax=Senna tora TaxID=362788 RepID=A0A834WI44_9FABA|nr:uncharacterized protein G2W53_022414 [Senna tora]
MKRFAGGRNSMLLPRAVEVATLDLASVSDCLLLGVLQIGQGRSVFVSSYQEMRSWLKKDYLNTGAYGKGKTIVGATDIPETSKWLEIGEKGRTTNVGLKKEDSSEVLDPAVTYSPFYRERGSRRLGDVNYCVHFYAGSMRDRIGMKISWGMI